MVLQKLAKHIFSAKIFGTFHRLYVKTASTEAHFLGFGMCFPLFFNFFYWIRRL